MKTSELMSRWIKTEARRISRAMCSGKLPRDLPVVEHDSKTYTDLRGLVWENAIDRDLTDIDFSFGDMSQGGGIVSMTHRGHQVTGCRFVGTKLWCLLAADFERCDFTRANMKGCNLRGNCTDCCFCDANMVSVDGGYKQRFIRCDFRGAKLRKASLDHSTFEDCLWDGTVFGSGTMVECTFWGAPTAEQLGDTIMESDITPELDAEIMAEVKRRTAAESRRKRPRR